MRKQLCKASVYRSPHRRFSSFTFVGMIVPVVLILIVGVSFAVPRLLQTHAAAPVAAAIPAVAPAVPAPAMAAAGMVLVYRTNVGPGADCGGICSEAVAALLQQDGLATQFVGPGQPQSVANALTPQNVQAMNVKGFAFPGDNGDVNTVAADLTTQGATPAIQNYVQAGGTYLGFCMGGYLAGTPGLALLPGDTDQYIVQAGATVTDPNANTTVQMNFTPNGASVGQQRPIYFQDGPIFTNPTQDPNAQILGTYSNGNVAMMVATSGQGKVGVVGPHPEASLGFGNLDSGAPSPNATDIGVALINTAMARP